MRNFFSMLKQEILFEIMMFFVFAVSAFILAFSAGLMIFVIFWFQKGGEIGYTVTEALLISIKYPFVIHEAKLLGYNWHIIVLFALMAVIHLPTFMKYTEDEEGNKIYIPSEKRTWQQWVIRFFILLISNAVILLIAGILIVSIDCLILLL
ncbi:hypothetical protein [Conchiformibius steedae]|uniref:hypothetical protein n=1 Tax=Conchiformibius steedae TaxID=153493 RepID=UPI0026ED8283|nr:hypothetical protein [Conchiformibius steedae]